MFTQRNILALLAVVVGLLFVAAPLALAAGDAHGEKDPLAFTGMKRWDLSIYTLVVFGLLFAILYFFAWPNIATGLKKREEMLSAVKDAAEKARREAEEASAKLKAEFATANDKVRAMLEEARRDADALRNKEQEAGKKAADAERERAKREIQTARDAALQEIYQKAVDLATLMSTKTVKKNLSAADHKALVDEALAELNAQPSRN
jgi:F-type H+-transporting ATPase subunit b